MRPHSTVRGVDGAQDCSFSGLSTLCRVTPPEMCPSSWEVLREQVASHEYSSHEWQRSSASRERRVICASRRLVIFPKV